MNQAVMDWIAPHSMEAEQGAIGSMLIAPDTAGMHVTERLIRENFFIPAHQTIFDAFQRLVGASKPVDFITLTTELQSCKELEAVGGPGAITRLWTYTPTAVNVRSYCDIILEKFRLRQLYSAAVNVEESVRQGADVDSLEGEWQDMAIKMAQSRTTDRKSISGLELAKTAVTRMEDRFNQKGELPGIPLGIPLFDHICRGAGKGQLILIGAPRKHGKSSLMRQWASNAIFKLRKPVGLISLEMSRDEMTDAFIHSRAGVSTETLEGGMCTEGEFQRVQNALIEFSNSPIYIRDEAMMTPPQILAAAREMLLRFGIEMLCIDYLQLIRPSKPSDNRQADIADISRWMKLIAKDLNIPVLVATQLNKEGDTRESLAPEMDCDKCIIVTHDSDEPVENGEAELRVKLHRGGRTGHADVIWRACTTTFAPMAREESRR